MTVYRAMLITHQVEGLYVHASKYYVAQLCYNLRIKRKSSLKATSLQMTLLMLKVGMNKDHC